MPGSPLSQRPVRIGLLRLTDAAPVVLAQASGLFAAEGVAVELVVEPSWANLADKLAYGLLDAAVMLPPLALALTLGLREAGAALIVPMSLSLNGNSMTLAETLAAPILDGGRPAPLEAGRRLRRLLQDRQHPTFAVVHGWSTHDLLLRYWLAASGIDPERDVALTVVPPADMADALAAGRIDGFCAGAPWGAMAARAGLGRTVVVSSGIWLDHPEKCLAVRADWATEHPAALQALLRALLLASLRCDDPAETPALAALLAEPSFVGVPAEAIAASLPGGPPGGEVDRSVFAAHGATFPWRVHARWFLDQMARWRSLPPGTDAAATAERVYRPDLYEKAATALGLPLPEAPAAPPDAGS
jgi:ABC-type nitrate/sulfonate/bicarbonate transport system substrate-binding protein